MPARCSFEQLYLVVFRSLRRPEANIDLLRERDDRAYEEALTAGGLHRYFNGHANERDQCLSFCLWQTGEQARKTAASASHKSAASMTAQTHLSYTLERYLLKKDDDKLVFERM
jgi:hypothetical protein